MNTSIRSAVCCLCLMLSMAAVNGVRAGTDWYSPLYSGTEEGVIRDVAFKNKQGSSVPTKVYRMTEERTIAVQVPKTVDRTALVPALKVTEGFAVTPEPGRPRDVTEPITYTLRHDATDRSITWRVRVFDATTGMIFRGSEFNGWKTKTGGYDQNSPSPNLSVNGDGLFFQLNKPDRASFWALFYYPNSRPVTRFECRYDIPVEHNQEQYLQLLDLANLKSNRLEKKNWLEEVLSMPDGLVRWSEGVDKTSDFTSLRANLSAGKPVKGPIGLRYVGAEGDRAEYRLHIQKVLILFE